MTLATGTRLEHYEIVEPLGAGGMGEVYVVEDLQLGRRLALKLLPARSTQERDRVRRFEQEARAASALNHPNIITIHQIGDCDAGRFIAMELVLGRTLREMAYPCSTASLVRIGGQMADALRVAHGAGITHRDIKPENVMVRDDGYVKVLDFGLARLGPTGLDQLEPDTTTRTSTGILLGTVRYMSPEQARLQTVTSATDIFSLGLVLYEMATGHHPFEAESAIDTLQAIVGHSPVPPSRVNLTVPAALDALILQMLEKDRRLRPSAGEVKEALAELAGAPTHEDIGGHQRPRPTRHVVGREKERADLRAGLDIVMAGRGLLLCVSGEPGVGKTTLVEDVLADLGAGDRTCRIARGRCSERLAGTEAYLPWLEALDGLLRDSGAESAVRVAQVLAPTWYMQIAPRSADALSGAARQPGQPPQPPQPPQGERAPSQERLKRELAALLQGLSRRQPLVLFFDDLHWADASTVDLLAFLADRFDGLRVLIVVTYRPSDLLLAKHPFAQLKQRLQARGVCHDIPLGFLTRDEVEHYLALEFPDHRFPPDLPARIHAKTDGSPLFMADLVAYLRDRGVIAQDQGRWIVAQPLGEIDRDLPESVRGMIERKIAQLAEDDRQLLVAASVQGYEFDSAIVAGVLGMDAATVEESLDVFEHVHALVRLVEQREFPDRTLTLRYRFVHVLYQNALYGSLQPTRKAQWAAALARALETFWGEQRASVANELALLSETAREFDRAADYFGLAARNANELFASHEAVALARRGLAMIAMLPPNRERLERELSMQVVLGNALMATRGYAATEVEQTYARAGELCRELGDTPHILPVLFGVYAFHVVRGKLRTALQVAEDFLARAKRQPGPAILNGHRMMGGALLYLGELTAAREHLERATVQYDRAEHRSLTWLYGQEPGSVVHSLLAMTLWLLGYPDQAIASSREALRLGREVSHAHTHAQVLTFAGMLHQFRREVPGLRETVDALVKLAAEQGMPFWSNAAKPLLGSVLAAEGTVEQGIDEVRAGLDRLEATGAGLFRPYSLCLLAEACGRARQTEAGLAALDQAERVANSTEEGFWQAELHRLRGELLLDPALSRQAEAEACLFRAIDAARRQQARSLELRAAMTMSQIWQRQGKRAEARALLAPVYQWFTEGFDTIDLKDAKALLQQLS
jgi:predicted ATPase